MSLCLLKITAKREGNQISTAREEVVQELPPDPHYWDAAAKILFKQMVDGRFSPGWSTREVIWMPEKYMQSYRPEKKDILDALAGYVWAKKTEVVFNLVVTIIGTGLTILMIAWLIHQIRIMWGV